MKKLNELIKLVILSKKEIIVNLNSNKISEFIPKI